jgi:hypothetical protein
MSCHLSDEQLQNFWAGKAAQADLTHIRGCDLCRTRLAELACDEQEVFHIGHLYLMQKRGEGNDALPSEAGGVKGGMFKGVDDRPPSPYNLWQENN